MQTFLPYKDFYKSNKILDYKRNGKQRQEAKGLLYLVYKYKQIDIRDSLKISDEYAALLWRRYFNHPCTLQWIDNESALCDYGIASCLAWIARGYVDNTLPLFENVKQKYFTKYRLPAWIGMSKFHNSHKSNLLRKKPEFYKQYKWKISDNLPYYWPSKG